MLVLPIQTRLLRPGDDIAHAILSSTELSSDDILVISSKAISTSEKRITNLRELSISSEAEEWRKLTGRTPAFCEAVIRETYLRHGTIVGAIPGAMMTELRPDGLGEGVILAANAGMDESNVETGFAVGWPEDPAASALRLRERLGNVAVIVSDSCCIPRRLGVVAYALAVSGIEPSKSFIGSHDLYGRELKITVENIADQLATAANFVMGNAAQSVPAAIIRDHGLELSDWTGWVPGIDPEHDLFRGVLL